MTDEEMLRNARLILRDSTTSQEGITLAAFLLFCTDELIISVLGHHKTDAIYRGFNVDRYDDRDVISTNLLESYDRMFEFGRQHLNDNFTLDGILSVRDNLHGECEPFSWYWQSEPGYLCAIPEKPGNIKGIR